MSATWKCKKVARTERKREGAQKKKTKRQNIQNIVAPIILTWLLHIVGYLKAKRVRIILFLIICSFRLFTSLGSDGVLVGMFFFPSFHIHHFIKYILFNQESHNDVSTPSSISFCCLFWISFFWVRCYCGCLFHIIIIFQLASELCKRVPIFCLLLVHSCRFAWIVFISVGYMHNERALYWHYMQMIQLWSVVMTGETT